MLDLSLLEVTIRLLFLSICLILAEVEIAASLRLREIGKTWLVMRRHIWTFLVVLLDRLN